MSKLPKSRRPDYVRPIRLKTQVIFVYANPKNKAHLEKSLKYLSASAWIDSLLGLIRKKHPDFQDLIENVERQPNKKDASA